MNRWACPKCGTEWDQPDCVVAIGHRCNPKVPRTFTAMRQTDRPSTDGDNQGQSTPKRKQKQ